MPKKRKNRPKKHKPRVPPLSALDTCIYGILFFAVMGLCFALLIGFLLLGDRIARADPTVVAWNARATLFWAFPFFSFVICGGLGAVCGLMTAKQPLFGNKAVRYDSPEWKRVYPLFMKNRPKPYLRPSARRLRRAGVWIIAVLLAVSAALVPLSLFGRYSLREDMSITVYGAFNEVKRQYTQEDIETATFEIYRTSKTPGWHMQVKLRMTDGKFYTYWRLDALSYVKAHVPPSSVRYKNEQDLEKLLKYERFDEAEQAQIRAIFQN